MNELELPGAQPTWEHPVSRFWKQGRRRFLGISVLLSPWTQDRRRFLGMSMLWSSWNQGRRRFEGMSVLCTALPSHPNGALVSQHPRTAWAVLVLSLPQDLAPCFPTHDAAVASVPLTGCPPAFLADVAFPVGVKFCIFDGMLSGEQM